MTGYRHTVVAGASMRSGVLYRDAGPKGAPMVLLLNGFPAGQSPLMAATGCSCCTSIT